MSEEITNVFKNEKDAQNWLQKKISKWTGSISSEEILKRLNMAYDTLGWTLPIATLLSLITLYINRNIIEKGILKGLETYKKWSESKIKNVKQNHSPGHSSLESLQQFLIHGQKKHPLQPPPLTDDMTVVIRVVDKNGKLIRPIRKTPQSKMKSTATSQSKVSQEKLKRVWEIVGETIGINETELNPVLMSGYGGALSFVTIPIPFDKQSEDLIGQLVSKLQQEHFIPKQSPSFRTTQWVTFEMTMIDQELHPELAVSVQL